MKELSAAMEHAVWGTNETRTGKETAETKAEEEERQETITIIRRSTK